ncbi:hypothetical protein LI328DRAFT_135144 [Trichoderma asperelloides]|nr:hypothetical protein LI328DRAFT_135144 [Trichoderma asperelloides]
MDRASRLAKNWLLLEKLAKPSSSDLPSYSFRTWARQPQSAARKTLFMEAGVVKPVSPCDNNSTLGLTLPSSQMQQVASGFHPFDSSNNVAIDSFLKDREAHEAAAINDHARKRP